MHQIEPERFFIDISKSSTKNHEYVKIVQKIMNFSIVRNVTNTLLMIFKIKIIITFVNHVLQNFLNIKRNVHIVTLKVICGQLIIVRVVLNVKKKKTQKFVLYVNN